MNEIDELKLRIERIGGQLVGVLAAVDALVGATMQTGAVRPDALRVAIRSAIEVFPMNPNMTDEEVAAATAFLTSVLGTVDQLEEGSS